MLSQRRPLGWPGVFHDHLRVIAEGERELAADSIRAAANRDPGMNVAVGLELGEFAAAFGGDLSREDEVSPASLWLARRRRPPRT